MSRQTASDVAAEGVLYEFLHPSYRRLAVYSRTDAVRGWQGRAGHKGCFGPRNKHPRDPIPSTCGETACAVRSACGALHAAQTLDGARIRETSIELLSRTYLAARSIEDRTEDRTDYQDQVATLIESWRQEQPQVAFLGAFSSGKSTLINRLLGEDVLASSRTPTTAVLTRIVHGQRRSATLEYRDAVELQVRADPIKGSCVDEIAALQVWVARPKSHAVAGVESIETDGVVRPATVAAVKQWLARRRPAPTETRTKPSWGLALGRRVARAAAPEGAEYEDPIVAWRVHFTARAPLELLLDKAEGVAQLREAVTRAEHALTLRQVTCRLPHPLLERLQLLDTAGLESPTRFHTEVTSALMERRPDKIVVLLDARRLDCPTNRSALAMLARFVATSEDYRRVTFALTFWDDALHNYMAYDAPETLDPLDPRARAHAAKEFGTGRRRLLRQLLETITGVPSTVEPTTFLLGLGAGAPPEMQRELHLLADHLRIDCEGWVGINLWADRWRAGTRHVDELADVYARCVKAAEARTVEQGDQATLQAHHRRIAAQRTTLTRAVWSAIAALRQSVSRQQELLRLAIERLTTRDALLSYVEGGYETAINAALDVIEGESARHGMALSELVIGSSGPRKISLDRAVMGISRTTQARAEQGLTGIGYRLQSIWDFFLGAIYELTAKDRTSVRAALQADLRAAFSLIDEAVRKWTSRAEKVLESELAGLAREEQDLNARLADVAAHTRAAVERLRSLQQCAEVVTNVRRDARALVSEVGRARDRVAAGAHPEATLRARIGDQDVDLRKGRQGDEWIAFTPPQGLLTRLELVTPDQRYALFPVWARGRHIDFGERGTLRVPVPPNVKFFTVHLGSMSGQFRLAP